MANVTDPLARNIHGTNPQNLIEYITRQKIYDSQYWKEECFGLNAVDIAAKAAQLRAVGGSYGGNSDLRVSFVSSSRCCRSSPTRTSWTS